MKGTGLIVSVVSSSFLLFTAPLAAAQSQYRCSSSNSSNEDKAGDTTYARHCLSWPLNQVPLEHRVSSCNRAIQNLEWNAAHEEAEAAPKEELIPRDVYLRLPQETTWSCPLDTADDDIASRKSSKFINVGINDKEESTDRLFTEGHPTRWILYNKASTPIILTHVNALGLEVSATDGIYPAHSNTAVYPHGPIVLPGQMAVINGVQGHLFSAREYNEVVLSSVNPTEEEDSWENAGVASFKKNLPRTLSFLRHQSSYESKGVTRLLGYPGRVLMKHRMGLIHVKNDSGALCPETTWGLEGNDAKEDDDGRKGNPRDREPLCNVLRKAFINKVGCPIDIYFAPQNAQGESSIECEKFTKHLGSLGFLAADNPNLDVHSSPLKFENTYNGHSFVARMAHDQSFVARIEIDHDIVRDCPEPRRSASSVEVHADETVMLNTPMIVANDTKYDADSDVGYNATVLASTLEAKRLQDKRNTIWNSHNHSGIKSALHIIAT